jgi:hypothetical protein
MKLRRLKILSMNMLALSCLSLAVSFDGTAFAQSRKKAPKRVQKSATKKASARKAPPSRAGSKKELQAALNLAKKGNYEEASLRLFNLSRSPRYERERMQIKYLLGLMLYDMKMYQVAAFQFVDVVRDGNSNYIKKSLEKLSMAADKLGDTTLLNYAISKVQLNDFPAASQDMLRFRIGEFQFRNGDFNKSAASFGAVENGSQLYGKAKYMEGLSYASSNKNEMAIRSFQELLDSRSDAPVTDNTRVSAILGLARTHYQNKEWDEAISFYRQVPRDTEQWHESLFEISWAQFRAAQFRSVLSNMHSLHSPYYEDFYYPETLLLRSLVYLYICQFDEMSKTLDLFEKTYMPIRKSLVQMIKTYNSPEKYFREIEKVGLNLEKYKKSTKIRKNSEIPFVVARKILKETDFSRSFEYIRMLNGEKKITEGMSQRWRVAPVGVYSRRILNTRIERARETAGLLVKKYIVDTHRDLLELFKQHDFARFEMLSGQKEQVRKQMLKNNQPQGQIEDDEDRSFYIQNGYEYWPFQGEYWLDEIGNYYYLGKSRCE